MSNPIADADALRAGWGDGWPRYREVGATLKALPDDRLNRVLDAAFADIEDRYDLLVKQMLGMATRALLAQYTRCRECGRLIAKSNPSEISDDHASSCSLHTSSVVGDAGPEPAVCILTRADGENPDDCTTHDHEPTEGGQ